LPLTAAAAEELPTEGRILCVHAGELLGYPPSCAGRLELHYGAFYRFDAAGKLVFERMS
jgi:hypothetical protein